MAKEVEIPDCFNCYENDNVISDGEDENYYHWKCTKCNEEFITDK